MREERVRGRKSRKTKDNRNNMAVRDEETSYQLKEDILHNINPGRRW